ncbi:glycine cleavage system protein H [Candidatus Acidulodesulfobacterium sp. H_13]|uniref:glycine cleavage system protein H n=1 Tax=Candidatus Acidulodesulfobacterium sp. H_13 TaxID=3395470 RepID=UPI003AF83270
MAEIQGCELPENLYYDIEKDVWAKPLDGNIVMLGMTDVAQTQAGKILHVTFKKVGSIVRKRGNTATIESGKWVGPIPSPVSGEIIEVNEVLLKDPLLLNISPYEDAWVSKVKASDLSELSGLLTGKEAVEKYREKIIKDQIQCMRCSSQ